MEFFVCPGFNGVGNCGFWWRTPGGTAWTTGLVGRVQTQDSRLLAAGRSVAAVAHDFDLSDRTIYNWRRRANVLTSAIRLVAEP
ncbi:helix-turn-helix domain-containing protein [Dietzia sp. CQ4]|nr:helix-turn-helix domain-containing protein [Dietzia sp. CQ4]